MEENIVLMSSLVNKSHYYYNMTVFLALFK